MVAIWMLKSDLTSATYQIMETVAKSMVTTVVTGTKNLWEVTSGIFVLVWYQLRIHGWVDDSGEGEELVEFGDVRALVGILDVP